MVIQYCHYSVNNRLDDYMQEQVLLYVPFRSKAVVVLDNNKYVHLYEDRCETTNTTLLTTTTLWLN